MKLTITFVPEDIEKHGFLSEVRAGQIYPITFDTVGFEVATVEFEPGHACDIGDLVLAGIEFRVEND